MAVKDRMTISELIETVLEKSRITGILGAQPHGLQKVANVLKLIELARTMEQNSEATLKNFLRRASTFMETGMEEPQAQVAASGEELVRIMTIHQSKGLEFPVVFLADINAAGGPKPSPVIFHPQRGLAVKYVDKARLSAHKGAVFDEVNRLNEKKERDDEERLFYVACTRAQDRLVLSGSRKRGQVARTEHLHELTDKRPTLFAETAAPEPVTAAPSVEKSAYDLLKEEAELETAKPAAVATRKARSKTGAVSQLSVSVGRMTSFVRCPREYLFRNLYGLSPAPVPNGGGENAAALGSAVHSALELVEFESDKNFKKSVGAAVDLKLSRWSKTEKKAAVKRIAALYDIDPFKKLRGGELSLVGREVDFTARFGGKSASCLLTGKLDLLLREGGDRIWVVDYKYSGAPRTDTAARFQLELYSLALSAYLGIESVTCALVYLKSEKRRVHKWELDRTRLKKLEKRLLKTALEIYDWEEKGRRFQGGYPSAKLMPEVDCPNPRCGFREFCLS
jgi:ATP-dependent helicase/nuclease subunit A